MKNYVPYSKGHWSTEGDEQKSLSKYLSMYEDVYNRENLNRIIHEIDSQETLKILDYGGGVGIISVRLAMAGHKVVLVDAAQKALNSARYYAEKESVLITTVCCDRIDVFSDEEFDIIIAKDLIEHVVDDEEMVCAFFKKLKTGGKLILTTQNSISPNYVLEGGVRKIIHPKTRWLGWDRTHVRFYTPRSLLRLSLKAGFNSTTFKPAYIFPYKLFAILLPWFNSSRENLLYKVDVFLRKLPFLKKFGWNIMMICKK